MPPSPITCSTYAVLCLSSILVGGFPLKSRLPWIAPTDFRPEMTSRRVVLPAPLSWEGKKFYYNNNDSMQISHFVALFVPFIPPPPPPPPPLFSCMHAHLGPISAVKLPGSKYPLTSVRRLRGCLVLELVTWGKPSRAQREGKTMN